MSTPNPSAPVPPSARQAQMPQVPGAGQRAQDQATDADSVFANQRLYLNDGDFIEIPPHPNFNMLGEDEQADYEALLFECESYDREDDIFIPEIRVKNADGNETGVVLPPTTRPGAVKIPHRKNGELITPPYNQRMVKAALGPEKYAKMRAGGKSSGDVIKLWSEQTIRITERQNFRPETNGSAPAVAPLPRGNSR